MYGRWFDRLLRVRSWLTSFTRGYKDLPYECFWVSGFIPQIMVTFLPYQQRLSLHSLLGWGWHAALE